MDGIDSLSRLGEFEMNSVSSDYFAVMGTRILRGRKLQEQDVSVARRVMVKNQIRSLLKSVGIAPLKGHKLWSQEGQIWLKAQVFDQAAETVTIRAGDSCIRCAASSSWRAARCTR